MPAEQGFFRSGGESVEQFAEYQRSKRLGEAVKQAIHQRGTRPGSGLDAATAAAEFAAWLRGRDTDRQELPDDVEELAARNATPPELADRCLPYAQGQPHPQIKMGDREPDYLARVIE